MYIVRKIKNSVQYRLKCSRLVARVFLGTKKVSIYPDYFNIQYRFRLLDNAGVLKMKIGTEKSTGY